MSGRSTASFVAQGEDVADRESDAARAQRVPQRLQILDSSPSLVFIVSLVRHEASHGLAMACDHDFAASFDLIEQFGKLIFSRQRRQPCACDRFKLDIWI